MELARSIMHEIEELDLWIEMYAKMIRMIRQDMMN